MIADCDTSDVAQDARLKAGTTYWVVANAEGGSFNLDTTNQTTEDPGAAAGWTIGDNDLLRTSDGTPWSLSAQGDPERPGGHHGTSAGHDWHSIRVAPQVGFEPTTNRLTADRSTTELLRSVRGDVVC